MRRKVYFNGKFYSAGLNGVHRVADRLIREVDALAGERPEIAARYDIRLLVPGGRAWSPDLSVISIDEQPGRPSQRWEQLRIAWAARDGLLINLCNLSPILHPNKVTLIHDAQFFLVPASYPLHFQLGYRALVPAMARTSRQVLTISDFSRDMLVRFGVAARDRIRVIENGADHILDQPARAAQVEAMDMGRRPYVLLFGSTLAYKNIKVVFEAFRGAALADFTLAVVGAGREELVAGGLDPPEGTRFLGRIDDGVLRALYERAHCLAFPSLTEGFGLPPVEAMLCGCPVVAAPAGAIPEVCGDAALYADPGDAGAWIAAVRRLADEPELRRRKIAEGETRAARFTWRRAGEALLAVIMELAG